MLSNFGLSLILGCLELNVKNDILRFNTCHKTAHAADENGTILSVV